MDMTDKHVLIIGGGNVAERRVRILSDFGAKITLISPKATEYIEQTVPRFLKRKYQSGDIAEIAPFLVITATDDRQANHDAMMEARSLDIIISVADSREECTCYFPAIVENESFVAGLVSKNGDHAGVKRVAEIIRKY